jgi:hypothetical protein
MIDVAALDQRIREIVRDEARPLYVSQRNSAAVLGIDARAYLSAARSGAFPSTKIRRVVTARTADVVAWLDARIAARAMPENVTPIDAALARVGARRVAT